MKRAALPTARDIPAGRIEPACECINCEMWTVVSSEVGEEVEISTSWEGSAGQEAAEDICDLMNMAFERGQETDAEIQRLRGVLTAIELRTEDKVAPFRIMREEQMRALARRTLAKRS